MDPCRVSADALLGAKLGITFDGKRYAYRQYRYDRFADAVHYAQTCRDRDGFVADDRFVAAWAMPFQPSDDDVQRMAPYGIGYADGAYRYDGYRYDMLESAIAYAARQGR